MTRHHQSANRAERSHALSVDITRRRLAARQAALQAQAALHLVEASDLHLQVNDHLRKQQHYARTADLIDQLITRYPDCPGFASLAVDRLMAGDEALAAALEGAEGI